MVTFIKSIIIGICAILPGISGSVVAISFKIYNRFIHSLSSIYNIKRNMKFIIIVIIGVLCGLFFGSKFLTYIFKYETFIHYILSGIILSEIPFIVNKVHSYSGNKVNVISLIISFFVSLSMDIINFNSSVNYSRFSYFIGGFLFSFGKIFPGISSSFFLLRIGIYENIIIIVSNPFLLVDNFSLYLPFILGVLIGIVTFYKLLLYLLNNKFELTYSIIIGFILSSVIILIPRFMLDLLHIIGILLMILSFVIFIYIKAKNDS